MKKPFIRLDEAIAKIDAGQTDDSAAEPLTPEEALAKIKSLASAGRIDFSPSDGVEALQVHVDRVLVAIGFPDAWVSDQSCIGDFRRDQSREEWATSASEKLGMIVMCGDYIVDVARRMKEMGNA